MRTGSGISSVFDLGPRFLIHRACDPQRNCVDLGVKSHDWSPRQISCLYPGLFFLLFRRGDPTFQFDQPPLGFRAVRGFDLENDGVTRNRVALWVSCAERTRESERSSSTRCSTTFSPEIFFPLSHHGTSRAAPATRPQTMGRSRRLRHHCFRTLVRWGRRLIPGNCERYPLNFPWGRVSRDAANAGGNVRCRVRRSCRSSLLTNSQARYSSYRTILARRCQAVCRVPRRLAGKARILASAREARPEPASRANIACVQATAAVVGS